MAACFRKWLMILLGLNCYFSFGQKVPNEIYLSNEAVVSLITCEADPRHLLTSFGHSAIRICDRSLRMDEAYSYGTLVLTGRSFLLDLVQNELAAELNVVPYRSFRQNYIYFNRYVIEQPLTLTQSQKQRLFEFLNQNASSQNTRYIYHYFANNCVTKLRDAVVDCLPHVNEFDRSTSGSTYRKLMEPYLKRTPWVELLFDVCLGIKADQTLTDKEAMFLPLVLKQNFEMIGITNPATVPSVQVDRLDYVPLLTTIFIGLCLVILSVIDYRRGKVIPFFDFILCTITGGFGVFLLICWLGYGHSEMGWNLNLLWLLPSNIFFAFINNKIYFKALGFINLAIVLFWFALPQEMNLLIMPLVLGLSIRYFTISSLRDQNLLFKMKKKRLDIEYTLDFDLYGITSIIKPYKMAWELNRCLNINLVKGEDYEVMHKNKSMSNYLHYTQSTTHSLVKLFRNKPIEENEERNLLLPELPHFDFVFLARGEAYADNNRLQELLRNIPSVELVAFIPLTALKSKEHFIF